MFCALDGNQVVWSAGQREPVDAIILATGYRPSLDYLRELGALDQDAAQATSAACPPLTSAWSTSAWSSSARLPPTPSGGVSNDARAVIAPLAAWIRDAPATVGLGA